MHTRPSILLAALFLTLGVPKAPAPGLLGKLKNK